jgi:tetratricopeptide (TPR) repeat protein
MILGFEAGARSQPDRQEKLYTKLIETYPNDERALNLVGNFYFARQVYDKAIDLYKRATTIAPDFSQPYNQLGYAYRFTNDYENAERTFKRYIEVLPGEPNPYDSYAEFLMKVGRFQESIDAYQKALSFNDRFMASYVGISLNYALMGEGEKSRETLTKMNEVTRTVAERRQVLFQTAVSYLHEGRYDDALAAVQKQYEIAEADHILATMAGDLNLMGAILLEAGRTAEALAKFEEAVAMNARADIPDENKAAARRQHLFNEARVALKRGDLETAQVKANAYQTLVAEHNVPFEMWQTHQLAGRIALMEKDYDRAITELGQAGTNNPRIHFWLAQAYQGKRDTENARAQCKAAADFNGLGIGYAYVRHDAKEMLATASATTDY